jgi:flagellar biosynthesis/type III secretory pathway protein FliH
VGDVAGEGPNTNVKSYSSKPGQMSGKAQADLASRIQAKANKKQPVTSWTPEQIAAENEKRGLKKGWADHNPIPSAEEEIMRFAQGALADGESAAANQLAQMMNSKAMLNPNHNQPSKAEFDAAGEAMGLGTTEEMVKAADQKWGNTMNWLQEAVKPISQRFASEAEELAYWDSIKINSSGGESGY